MGLIDIRMHARPKGKKGRQGNSATGARGNGVAEVASVSAYAERAGQADTTTRAEHAGRADVATRATTADTATRAEHAGRADVATWANTSTTADTATRATTADTATRATTADTATRADTADDATPNSAMYTRFISKERADTAQGEITLAKGAKFGEFTSGALGGGGRIDEQGRAELQSLSLRQWLEVPELRYNRTTVHIGASFHSPASGLVARVERRNATQGRIYLKLEQGELGTVEVGDLLMGIYHATPSQGGATADSDNGKNDVLFAGFATAYFEATAIDTAGRTWVDYTLRPGTTTHPSPFMTFASRGNTMNADRQQFVFATRSYTRYLSGVNSWDIQPIHIAMQLGDLSNVSDSNHPNMRGVGIYCDNAYLGGEMRIKASGKRVEQALAELGGEVANYDYLRQLLPQSVFMGDGAVIAGALLATQGDKVRAYLNGIEGKPALATGVEHYGEANETHASALNFDGSGHLGRLCFETINGVARLYIVDDTGRERVTFSQGNVPTRADLDAQAVRSTMIPGERFSVSARSPYQQGRVTASVGGRKTQGRLPVEGGRGSLSIHATISMRIDAILAPDDVGDGVRTLTADDGKTYLAYEGRTDLLLMREGDPNTYRHLGSIAHHEVEGEGYPFAEIPPKTIDLKIQGIPDGVYYLELRVQAKHSSVTGRLNMLAPMRVIYDAIDRRTHIGGNGISSNYERHQWVHIADGQLQASGKTNIPGVLLSGLISTGDTTEQTMPILHQWGARTSTSQSKRHAVGSYRVYHNVGHKDYSVQITPRVQWGRQDELPFIGVVQEVNEFDFFVYLKTYDGKKVDGEFYFTIIGRNY